MTRTNATITRRRFLSFAGGATAAGVLPHGVRAAAKPQAKDLPNIVIIFADDQGYQDVGCFGSPKIKTPNLDRMAKEGMRFTDFYVAQPVCGASRAALLTGCYPNRIGMLGAPSHRAMHGIHPNEMLIPELVKQKGYATAMYGKWHLGHRPESLPPSHGFDDYFGLPYSNDMWPFHPTAGRNYPPLPLIEGTKTIRTNPDQTQLTTWYTERGVKFIRANKDRPFFLYIAHNMPHVPLFVSTKHKGKSARGLYGDVIEEIDWCVGQVLATLKECGLDEKTLVVFTSDNGPWLSYGDHGGCALPLREGKGTTWDGGVREPTIMRWPDRIPAGSVCKEPAMTIDILPTIAGLIGGKLPDHTIDGKDIWPLLTGTPGATSPHDALYFYWGKHLQAVRMGKWKLHFPHAYRTMAGKPGGTGGKPTAYSQAKTDLVLYDLEADIGETTDVKDKHPDVVRKIQALADKMRADIGDSATKQKGANCREPQRFAKPTT